MAGGYQSFVLKKSKCLAGMAGWWTPKDRKSLSIGGVCGKGLQQGTLKIASVGGGH